MFSTAALLAGSLKAEVIKPQAQALEEAFPAALKFEPVALSLSAQERLELKAALGGRLPSAKPPKVFQAWDKNGRLLGLALVDDELGKHQPITYLLAVDTHLRIQALELLIFRESQGDGVRSRRFRAQFRGKGLSDPLQLGKDLDAVSGATISSRTLAYGARKCLRLAAKLLSPKEHSSTEEKVTGTIRSKQPKGGTR